MGDRRGGLSKTAVVDLGVVLDGDLAAYLMLVEDSLGLQEHLFRARLTARGDVGDREQPPMQAVEVEHLLVVEGRPLEGARTEEGLAPSRRPGARSRSPRDPSCTRGATARRPLGTASRPCGAGSRRGPPSLQVRGRARTRGETARRRTSGTPVRRRRNRRRRRGGRLPRPIPATLVKRGWSRRRSSAAARISGLGSTPKTRLPFSRKSLLRMPVPEPTSATTESPVRPHSVRSRSRTARG